MKSVIGILFALFLLAAGIYAISQMQPAPSFKTDDIADAEQQIKALYLKKQIVISEVHLIRENSRKLTGYAKYVTDVPLLGQRIEMTVKCDVQMGDTSRESVVSCMPAGFEQAPAVQPEAPSAQAPKPQKPVEPRSVFDPSLPSSLDTH